MGLLKLIGCDDESQLRRIREREEQRQGFLRRKAAREKEWNEEHGISEAAAAYAAPTADSGNGGAVQNALLNMFSTSDLDQIFADCSPKTTQTLYGAANMTKANNLELRAMKSELATDQRPSDETYAYKIIQEGVTNNDPRLSKILSGCRHGKSW